MKQVAVVVSVRIPSEELRLRTKQRKRIEFPFHHSFSSTTNCIHSPILGPDLPDIWPPPAINHSPHTSALQHGGHTVALLDGKPIAKDIKSEVAAKVSVMNASIKKCPGLASVIVGKRKDSHTFIRIKLKACDEVGITTSTVDLPEDCSLDKVLNVVSSFNQDPSVHGIIVQLPLPQHLDEEKIVNFVSPEKDVDGFHPLNVGNLAMKGREPFFIPCDSRACIQLLLRYGVEIKGKKAVVIGRSKLVGLPTSLLLQRHHATVSTVHAFTEDPEQITSEADILVSDVGVPNLVRGSWIKPGAIVNDTGANSVKDPDSRNDVCYEEAIGVASAITPVPGGVGPVAISMLLSNTLDSAKRAFRFP